jgi:hypothetical protein
MGGFEINGTSGWYVIFVEAGLMLNITVGLLRYTTESVMISGYEIPPEASIKRH